LYNIYTAREVDMIRNIQEILCFWFGRFREHPIYYCFFAWWAFPLGQILAILGNAPKEETQNVWARRIKRKYSL
jgi:hypothetical protein